MILRLLLSIVFLCLICRARADVYFVNSTADAGPGSLRQAINDANAHPNAIGQDEIHFNIPGTGVRTIALVSALPEIAEGVVVDGWAQPGFQDAPLIELTAAPGLAADGLRIMGGSTLIRGLIINGFQNGIYVGPVGGNSIQGCHIGTDKTGTQIAPNDIGIFVRQSGTTVIGSASRNLISGNRNQGIYTVRFDENSTETQTVTIKGNYIGTDVTGTKPLPNGFGVSVVCRHAVIGGTEPDEGNLVSGNTGRGMSVFGLNARVLGNLVGTTASGLAALPNGGDGIELLEGTIGGTEPGARNIISGNLGSGVSVVAGKGAIHGNFIGTDVSGKISLPNIGSGVSLTGSSYILVGGRGVGAGNLISGNLRAGIGFFIFRSPVSGFEIPPSSNIVQGNFIGTDLSGTTALPNGGDGIYFAGGPILVGAAGNLIGGRTSTARNVISGNLGNGIFLEGRTANPIQGNLIGTAADGKTPLGNGQHGIRTNNAVSKNNFLSNLIGGAYVPDLDAANVIAFNLLSGISETSSSTANQRVSANSIHGNGQLGIDLGEDGVTPNDPGDADTGASDLQNFPVIGFAFVSNGNLTIYGNINSRPSRNLTLEFFANQTADSSGFGEGEIFLGQAAVTTDNSGDAAFNVTFPLPANVAAVTGTAIDPDGNTSEFSAALSISPTEPPAGSLPPTPATTVLLPTRASQLLNLSTRLRVEKDDRLLIGGFIVSGTEPKKIILRGIGPSLAAFGIADRLEDPVLELYSEAGQLLASNDNWKDDQRTEIENSGVAPGNNLESAIVQTVAPGNYTGVLRGKNESTGIGMVEIYDLNQDTDGHLVNVSTRGFVGTGDNVMIGGFIVGGKGGGSTSVVVRAIGPSLASLGVPNPLADPTLMVRNANGAPVAENDNWKENVISGSPLARTHMEASGLPPADDRESAVVLDNVAPGYYSAIVRGKNNSTGIALVEVYNLR